MNFRSFDELNRCIVANLHKIPNDVDLIVGIPRSGLLVANILALHLNLPVADFEGFLEGRMLSTGRTRRYRNHVSKIANCNRVLLVDDSVNSGKTLAITRQKIETSGISQEILYLAAYVTPDARDKVDIYFDICPWPRMFGWNIMHHAGLNDACLDIDGVLCRDPSSYENDDGEKYLKFLETAEPMFLPKNEVGYLVTCRLEKYRLLTEKWLERNGIKYKQMFMMNLPNKAARLASASHGAFKAGVYCQTNAKLIIERNYKQAL
ncbi:MAG: phosphoribosyltransferase [Xenococcus sp. (in: cyanobacteria)]